jgi:hypothetical protein
LAGIERAAQIPVRAEHALTACLRMQGNQQQRCDATQDLKSAHDSLAMRFLQFDSAIIA